MVDSLILEELSEADQILLESSLKRYHKAKNDTLKIKSLDDVCDNMMDKSWGKFQLHQYKLIQEFLTQNSTPLVKYSLNVSLAKAYNNLGYYYGLIGNLNKNGL